MDLDRLAALILDPGISPALIYAVLFLGCVLESFFPPWPSDLVALYAGFLAGRHVLDPATAFVVAVLGSQAGVMSAFWITRRWGRVVLAGPMGRYLPTEQLARLELWFFHYGAPAIAVSRFFPGIRALVMPAAGLARVATWKVWVYAGGSVVVWNLFVVGLGFLAGTQLAHAKQVLINYNVVAAVVIALGLAGAGLILLYRRFLGR